jgi:MraZ protein
MFRGRFDYTIDAKGRMSIPAKFRDVLRAKGDEKIVVTNSFEGCLVAYALDEWREIEDKLTSLNEFRREVRAIKRLLLGGAVELTVDKQGRVLIPPSLRKDAELEHDIVLQGLANKFEIWSSEKLTKELDFAEDNLEESAQFLAESGLNL